MQDHIACLNPETDELVYERPTALLHYPNHIGDMYEVSNDLLSLKVTMGHRMYVKHGGNGYQLVSADKLVGSCSTYKNNAEWYNRGISSEEYNKMKNKIVKYDVFPQEFITSLNREQARDFIDYYEKQKTDYRSKNYRKRLDQISQLCLHAGWSYTINKFPGTDVDLISIMKESNDPIINIQNNKEYNEDQNTQYFKYEPPQGTVYEKITKNEPCPLFCLQVPTEIFYVRRNGRSCWTGNSRATGPVTKLTRQPVEGRNKFGGLRMGEMEKDVGIVHGASALLQDRLFYNSDMFRVHICDLCSAFCQYDLENQRFLCKCSNNRTQISQVYIPYACKLLFQELESMGIHLKLILE
jgi:hypothetical protein